MNVMKNFVDSIVEIAEKIEKLFKTNTPIVFIAKQRKTIYVRANFLN